MSKELIIKIPKDPWFFITLVLGFVFIISIFTHGFTNITGFSIINQETVSKNVNSFSSEISESKPAITLIELYDPNCSLCYNVRLHESVLRGNFGLNITKINMVDINTNEGRMLLSKYNITAYPTIIISPEIKNYTEQHNILLNFGKDYSDGYYVFTNMDALQGIIYYKLVDGEWKLINPYLHETGENETRLKFFIVANCPWCQRWEKEIMPSFVNDFGIDVLEPHYLVGENNGNFSSMHGPSELEVNKIELCVLNQSKKAWYDYTLCYDENGACEQYYNETLLENCLNSTVNNLLHNDAELSSDWGVSATPTFYVNYNGTANILRSEWARFVNGSVVTDYETFKSDFCKLINNSLGACS